NIMPGSIRVLGSIYWGGDFAVLKENIRNGSIQPGDIHFFLGYSGWDGGQLENEIKENSWLVSDVDEHSILEKYKEISWANFVKKAGTRYRVWENFPENPMLN
ncbi:MAG: transcriptional regulator, partial [Draconibacterium sp.]